MRILSTLAIVLFATACSNASFKSSASKRSSEPDKEVDETPTRSLVPGSADAADGADGEVSLANGAGIDEGSASSGPAALVREAEDGYMIAIGSNPESGGDSADGGYDASDGAAEGKADDEDQVIYAETKRFAGIARVRFFNYHVHSNSVEVKFPSRCDRPVVILQSLRESILCGSAPAGQARCANDRASTSTDLKARVGKVTPAGMRIFLSAQNPVWVGARSPLYDIAYQVSCREAAKVETPKAFAGFTTIRFFNNMSHSIKRHVELPQSCVNPVVVTQTIRDSVYCGAGAGTGICTNETQTASTDLESYGEPTDAGISVYLSAQNNVWVGASSPAFKVAFHVTCQGGTTASQRAGTVTTRFFNYHVASNAAKVKFEPRCARPVVITRSYKQSVLCGNGRTQTSSCLNEPKSASTAVVSYVSKYGDDGFNTFLSATSPVWVSARSPKYTVGYSVTCGP